MLRVAGIVGLRISIHGNFHKRNIFPGYPAGKGAENGLGQIVLRAEQNLFKSVIGISRAVSGNVSGSALVNRISFPVQVTFKVNSFTVSNVSIGMYLLVIYLDSI